MADWLRPPTMRLRKAPVQEAWIAFRFEPGENAPTWGAKTIDNFLSIHYGDTFKVREYTGSYLFEPPDPPDRDLAAKDIKSVLLQGKAVNRAEDRHLHVGRDVFIYRMLRKQAEWPEYNVLKDEALQGLSRYREFFCPARLVSVDLCYRDVVAIPCPGNSAVNLQEYMTLVLQVPNDAFGPLGGFRFRAVLYEACKSGRLLIDVRLIPQLATGEQESAEEIRIQIDWLLSSGDRVADLGSVPLWLDTAHSDIDAAFRAGFTDKGWAMFEEEQ